MECGLDFSSHAKHVRNFSRRCVAAHRNWQVDEIISRLMNPRRACQSQTSRTWFFFIYIPTSPPFLLSSSELVSAAGSDDALKLKTLEMGHSRYLFLSLSLSFSSCLVLRKISWWKGSRTERKGSPSDVGCHSSYSFESRVRGGEPRTGRSNECGVNRLQETQKITSQRGAREETSLSWLKEQGRSVSWKKTSKILGRNHSVRLSIYQRPFLMARVNEVILG